MSFSINDLIDPISGERRYLNKEERGAFKAAVQYMKPDAKLYCLMLYYTGCRANEALEITPDRLDFKECWVRFRTLKQNPDRPDKYRIVELPEEYLAALESEYKAKTRKGKRGGKIPLWSFGYRTGYKYVKQAMQAAGIEGKKATPRGLRHSMGVMLALDKVPVNVIQDILGHTAVQNTLIYMQIVGNERRELISGVW